ncbi:MAG: CDP-glycerol glycerophosphotransferase family protein [Candidatus Cloacimonetes bacterium]|nr:CDP-glycerol glycerophosphotransferase family protein [Candidatus Cloacimonadota bacterium]
MVFTYYLSLVPYHIAWYICKLFRRKKLYLLHVEDPFDYFIFRNIAKHLSPMGIVLSSKTLIPKLQPMLPPATKIYLYPFCFPDGVIMFRNAAWKYPVKSIIKIGLEHGAYNFKRFPKAYYYNLFNLYMMTSMHDVTRIKARGAKPVKAIGYPKSDSLFDGSYPAEQLNELRNTLNLDKDKPTLLFSSTWDGSGMSAAHKWYDKVQSLATAYNVLVTLHPRMSEYYKDYFANLEGIHYINAMDIYPYLLISDVCIGDTNSLIAEFCIVNRPIITFSIEATKRTMDDVIELIKSVSIRIDSFEELPAAIDEALSTATNTAAARAKVIRTLINPLDGNAGLRAAQEICILLPELKL